MGFPSEAASIKGKTFIAWLMYSRPSLGGSCIILECISSHCLYLFLMSSWVPRESIIGDVCGLSSIDFQCSIKGRWRGDWYNKHGNRIMLLLLRRRWLPYASAASRSMTWRWEEIFLLWTIWYSLEVIVGSHWLGVWDHRMASRGPEYNFQLATYWLMDEKGHLTTKCKYWSYLSIILPLQDFKIGRSKARLSKKRGSTDHEMSAWCSL